MKRTIYSIMLSFLPLLVLSQGVNHVIKLSPNAVKVDADRLFPYSDGYAVITKGQSHALIDKTGKIVIPYNTYTFAYNQPKTIPGYLEGMYFDYGFINGFAEVQDVKTQKLGLLDTNLRLTIPCEYSRLEQAYHSNLVYVTKEHQNSKYEHLIFKTSGELVAKVNDRFRYRAAALNPQIFQGGKWGYVDYFGKTVIPPQFERAEPFSGGMAVVAQYNEFDQLKWTYIDETGAILPFQYSNRPGDFHEGMALVEPAVKDEFQYAYLNLDGGNFVVSNDSERTFYPSNAHVHGAHPVQRQVGAYVDGKAIWFGPYRTRTSKSALMLLDKSGNGVYYINLLEKYNWPSNTFAMLTEFVNKEAIIVSNGNARHSDIFAIANLEGEIIVRTGDKEGELLWRIESLFDPVSGLARVDYYGSGNFKPIISGYTNRQGEVVIILGEKQIW